MSVAGADNLTSGGSNRPWHAWSKSCWFRADEHPSSEAVLAGTRQLPKQDVEQKFFLLHTVGKRTCQS